MLARAKERIQATQHGSTNQDTLFKPAAPCAHWGRTLYGICLDSRPRRKLNSISFHVAANLRRLLRPRQQRLLPACCNSKLESHSDRPRRVGHPVRPGTWSKSRNPFGRLGVATRCGARLFHAMIHDNHLGCGTGIETGAHRCD
ncbi:hypothetical protein CDD81_2864 [Ophiocordyceps australis]|uniref:Uncharacterized protein n=1 Tax=Ophiocordyceps australis TaxID=1399860 RepID=A0A2C5XSW6_9HYPO|nr:hypothetical protein CDD81_2864 [Ophiocordyceps australis]